MIAGFFKQRRSALDMTREELAEKTAVGLSTIKLFEAVKFRAVLKHYLLFY
jgi:transcriptional regulator with XRE-family HTH domain